MSIFSPRLRTISIFVLTYFIAGFAIALMRGNQEFLFYEGGMALIIAAILYMDRRIKFSQTVLWGLAIWGLLHLSGGLLPIPADVTEPGKTQVLYNLRVLPFLPKYDQIVHAFGFGMSVLAAKEAMEVHFKRKLSMSFAIGAMLFFIACGLGALNEMIEFTAVLLVPETNVGGYENTGWDMVSNAAGALLAILYLKVKA